MRKNGNIKQGIKQGNREISNKEYDKEKWKYQTRN